MPHLSALIGFDLEDLLDTDKILASLDALAWTCRELEISIVGKSITELQKEIAIKRQPPPDCL